MSRFLSAGLFYNYWGRVLQSLTAKYLFELADTALWAEQGSQAPTTLLTSWLL